MALNLPHKVVDLLKQNPEQRFTAREIAEWVFATYPEECREKQKSSKATVIPLDSERALLTQIVAEIGAHRPAMQKNNPKIKTTEGRPRKYYFTELMDSAEVDRAGGSHAPAVPSAESIAASPSPATIREHDLYPKLTSFLWSGHKIHSKRIDEKRSSNSHGAGGNRWLYPDLVGMENLSQDWHLETKGCVQEYSDKRANLWSFEVKILINRSNVRESFFQTVSNSSWANFGYLVAVEVVGDETLDELRMLSSLHGIGLIGLEIEDPSESQIMIPARKRLEIDWNIANRLVSENKDFLNYIKSVRQFHQTGEAKKSDWDAVPKDD